MLKDLLLDYWNRVVVLQCVVEKDEMVLEKKENPTSAPWSSRVQITESQHHSLSQLNSVFAEFGGWQVNRNWIIELAHRNKREDAQDMFRINTTPVTHWGPLNSLHTKKLKRLQDTKSEMHKQCISNLLYSQVYSLILNAGGRTSSVLLPLSFLKDNFTQVVWDFEARLGKHLGIKQLQTLTAHFFLTKYWLLFFFSFPFCFAWL